MPADVNRGLAFPESLATRRTNIWSSYPAQTIVASVAADLCGGVHRAEKFAPSPTQQPDVVFDLFRDSQTRIAERSILPHTLRERSDAVTSARDEMNALFDRKESKDV